MAKAQGRLWHVWIDDVQSWTELYNYEKVKRVAKDLSEDSREYATTLQKWQIARLDKHHRDLRFVMKHMAMNHMVESCRLIKLPDDI